MAERGSATAKLSVIPSFEQKNIKAMGDQLVNGIKASLKDIKLESVFNDANILNGVKKEIEEIDVLFKNRTLKRLDFSELIPPLTQALEDKSLSEEIRLQIIQGFKEGLESGRTLLQGMPSGMTGKEIKEQFRQSMIMSDAIDSLPGLNKSSRNAFKKQWAPMSEKDIKQLMAMMDIADQYSDVLPYLLDETGAGKMIGENIMSTKEGAPQKAIAAIARLQAIAHQDFNKGKKGKQIALEKILDQKIGNETIQQISDRLQATFPEINDLFERVYNATIARDNAFENISWSDASLENLLMKTLQRGYKTGSLQKTMPLYNGNYTTPSHITLSDLAEVGDRTIDRNESQNNESLVERAENAANRAETASEEARAVAEDMKGTVKEGTAEASGISKKSKKKSSTQTSSEPVEQIADDAEADAENAERVVDALDDKKTRLESTITELENKNRELQELNNKYQKAISDTFGEVKTPEEALALFKEKATQLQQADKDFADIIPQRNFTDPSNSEEIAILEEYEKRLAALQQALVEYQKAGETAIDKGVNPTDIRANQVDEERLQLNFADSTIDGYIKGLQKAIEDNKKKINEYENLLKTYKGQLEEFTRQGSPSDVKPSGGGQTQSRPVVDTAREEAGEVRKSREELQVEREKLEAEIQNSTQLMNGAERQIVDIDQKIGQAQNNQQRNEANISRLTEKKERIESQIQQTKDELKTIKERLQDAVDAKQAAEEEIKTLEEKLSSADSDIISADFPENASRYNELKAKRDYHTFEQEGINRPILDDLKQEKQSIEDILNQSYSVKTMDEAYKQAMQRKKEYLEKRKKYAEAIKEAEKNEIGSADWMMKIADSQSISAEQDTAWIAYYKSMQEFESHGKDSKSKRTKRERLYSGMSSTEMPDEESAEIHLSDLQDYLVKLNNQIADREKLIELTQKELDKLQQEIDELSSHVVTVDSISEQLEQKKQEQQKFEQEEANWTAQQDTKQAELDNLNEQLNGTRGIANYLKAVQEGQQNNQEELVQLQQQRAEQQRIYDDAKRIQEESLQRQAEIDRMIVEAESREQQPPSTTPATTQEKPSAPISSGQAGEESPVIQNLEQQIKEVETTIKTAEIKQKELLAKKEELNKLLGEYGKEANNIFYLTDNTEETSQYWGQAGSSTKDPATGAARQLREKGQIFKDTIDAIKEQKQLLNSLDKESNEYQQAEQKLQQLRDKKSRDWLAFYRAHEQLDYWVGKEEGNTRAKQTLNKWTPEKMGLENLGFSQENLDKMIADVKGQAERLAQMRADVAVYQEQYNQLQEQINTLNTKRDNLIAESKRAKPAESKPSQGTNADTPLSSSGAETASGVHQEGAEADDAAAKMKALADAKKEALEANQKLAESADITNKALKGEGDSAVGAEFNALFLALSEIYDLLSQFPIVLSQFNQGLDIASLTEQFKVLLDSINRLPKEGFNLSLSDGMDTFVGKIDEALNKLNDFLVAFNAPKEPQDTTKEYAEQIEQIKQVIVETQKALEINQKLIESTTDVNKAIQNESIAGDFNALIIALSEIYELLSKLPNSFTDFNKSVKTEPLIKQFKALSESLNAFSKTNFNESIGKSFDKLNSNIDKTLKKLVELSTVSKTEEISKGITEKYEKQITKLRQELNEAKKALKELETLKQRLKTEDNNSVFDSSNNRIYTRNVAKRASKRQTPETDPLIKEYEHLRQVQDNIFKTTNIEEYNKALKEAESILQKIINLEQSRVSIHSPLSQTDYLIQGYGDDPYDTLSTEALTKTIFQKANIKDWQTASKERTKTFVTQQKQELQLLEESIQSIQLIPEEQQVNWDQEYAEKYRSITKNAQDAAIAVQLLKDTLGQMKNAGLDQNALRSFLEFKQFTTEQIGSTQKEDSSFKSNIVSTSDEYINKLSEIEAQLTKIKTDSEKLINIDPSIGNTLIFVEQYLNRIKELKEAVSKNPLNIYDTNVRGRINNTISELTNKGNKETDQSMLEQMEQVSKRSQTDFGKLVTNYSKYATALNKLFTDIVKGSKTSTSELEKDFARINDFSSKLTRATGLEKNNLLTGELQTTASPQITDAQTEAANKTAIAYETMFTKIEAKAESTRNTIEQIFGTEGIAKGLDEFFIGGKTEGFDIFVQNANKVEESLKRLEQTQDKIKSDATWLLQSKNAEEYHQIITTVESSLAEVTKTASNFKIVDALDVQKLRASTTQFIRDNPALTGNEITELENYINQLQGKINAVDFKNIENGIQRVKQGAIEAGHTGETFLSMLTKRFKSLGAYLLSFVSFYRVIGVFKDGLNIIKELDTALTEMNKVSTESLNSLKEYQKESFDMANGVGTTAVQLQQSTADFIRLGESFQEAKESARVANELMTVSEFDNIQDATTALVSISAAYEDAANGLDKQAIIDKLNKIGDEYAISTDGLATALQDSASALTTANNDMDEAAALIAAGNTVTQDPSKTGKAMRTVALRLVGTKEAAEELEEMGEDTSDMIISQSKMREMIMNATKVASNNYQGVDIQDEIGRYKSTFQILNEIGSIWDEIKQADLRTGDNRQNLLLEAMAGKNRANTLASVLMNNDVLQSAYQDSKFNAAGKATEELEKVSQGIEFHLTRLRNAWQELWANAANRDVINFFIDLATKIVNIIDKVGLLGTAFTVVWGASVVKSFATADSWLVKIIRGLNDASNSGKTFGQIMQDAFGFGKKGDTRWKGLAQIGEDNQKRKEQNQPTAESVPATTPIPVNEQKEKEKAERIAREKVAAEEIEREKKIAREKAEAQRITAEQAEADRIRREKIEAERRIKEKTETEKRVAEQAVNAENEAMVKASASITEKGQAEATSAKEASLNANASKEAAESALAEAEANKILTQEVRERINAQVAERRQELNGTKTKFSKAKLARMQAEDDTYRKELEAEYINEYKKNNPQPIVEQPVPVVQPTSVASDSAEIATKTAKAEASREVAQATAEELTWAQLLRQEEQEGIATETEGLATKTEEVATSQQVAQGNLEIAESAGIATKAAQEQLVTEEALAEQRAANQLMNMSPTSAAQFSNRYDKLLKESYSKAGKETMDWSMSYVTVGEEVENIGEEVGDVVEKTSSGLGIIGTKLLGLATNPMVWLIGIPALIGAVNLGLSAWQKHQQALIDGAHEATTAWNDNKTSIDNYIQQYQDLHTQLENTNLSEEEQIDIKNQLFDLQKQITDEYGHQADGVNLVNGQLDEQIEKLRTINKEQASNNLGHNAKEYKNAVQEIERQREYNIRSLSALSTEDFDSLTKDLSGTWKRYIDDLGDDRGLTFIGNALEAEKSMDELFERLSQKQDELGEGWKGSIYESLMNELEGVIRINDETLTKFKDDYNSYLEQSIYAQNGMFGEDNLSAGEALIEAQKAVNDYNMALSSGDLSQINNTKVALDKVKQAVNEVVDAMGDKKFERPFEDIFNQVNQVQEEAYNVKNKFNDPKVKNVVESILGTPQDNKKSAKEIPNALRDAAENLLDEQRKAYEWGMKPFGVNPLEMMYSQSQFGNIDMNNRPTIKWNDDWKKRFAEALKSWDYNPENGTIDTVFGGSDNFNGIEIAYTPILATKDGKVKDFMSYDAVHEYIQGLVEEATDEEGNIDAQLILDMDAGKVKDVVGKQIIGAIDGIGKYSANTVGKMMHFSGTKGAISLGMEQLSKAAKDAGVDVQKVLDILQKTGNVDALSGLFDNFKYDVSDIEGYLSNLSNLPPEIASDIQTIADAFGITAESSQESINAVAELLGSLGYIATTSLEEAGESFDKFTQKASGWIEETSNLSSVLSKGQGFLTFTKTQDDQGHEIASEVKALADAYKDLPGYNYASLFEETASGIMVNADALRALQSQEESMRHAEFYEKRQDLMEKFTASSGAAAEAYRAQIEELDMLWSAYSGATSALSKYQNNHGAADYSTNYKLFRDQIFKEGDEYLNSGETGEEGFRRIAQLFSYKDLALASVTEVEDAFIHGADTMQKFFTEDPTEGANLWIDEIMSWPEEYAKISTNAAGETVMTMTDQNLDAVAKYYGVSKDLILSLMNELNATGSRVHFFTDGQMQQLEQVNERAEAARKALIGMKEQGTDPALANSDILNFDMANMSAEELEAKIKEIQDFKEVNPDIDTETASLLDELLKSAIESLDLINGKHVEPQLEMNVDGLNYSKEVAEDLNERLKQISEYQELGYDITITGDEKVKEISTEIASWSEEMQKSYGFEPSINPEDIAKQIEEKFPDGIKLQAVPEIKQEDVDAISGAAPEVKVNADTLPAQTAIEHLSDDFTPIEKPISADTSQAEEQTDSLFEKITAPIKAIFGMEVYADEVDEAREEAEKPIETDVHFKPDNSVQDAANQAGAQQGVNTTTTETKVTNEETHTVATADTAQLDVLNQKMQSVQAMGGSTVSIGVAVSGIENIEAAEGNINRLIAKDKSKVTVSINGNAAMFNKTYSQTNTALNTLAQKKTEPKITANNSNLKDKVSDSKEKLNSIKDKSVKITANQSGFSTISSWKNSVYDNLRNKDIYIRTHYSSTGTQPKSTFQGSAHNQGTIVSKGHAYASGTLSGDWGLPKAEKGALINELGSEIIVTPDGHWQILNSGDPTFVNLPKGSIIFNHKQSESLLKKGYINGSHGKMVGGAFVNGTVDDEEEFEGDAYAIGTTGWNGSMSGMAHASAGTIRKAQKRTRKNSTSSSKSSSGSKKSSGSGKSGKSSGNSSSNKKAKDNLQTLDAIEIRLNRIDALISQLDANAAKTYETFTGRNSALTQDLATVQKEINAINSSLKATGSSYNYLAKASAAAKEAGLKSGDEGYKKGAAGSSGVALSQLWINRIQNSVNNGKYFTINDVKDEGLWKKIQAYQTWYEKYVKLQQKAQEQTAKLSQLTIQQLTLIQTKWESTLNNISASITGLQNQVDLMSERGYEVAESLYTSQITQNKSRIDALTKEATELQKQLDDAVKTGRIKQYSEEWYKWHIQIKNINNEITATNKEIQSLNNSIRQLKWDRFDRGQDELSNLIDEADFLAGLINEIDLFDKDTGIVTSKGKAAFGLEAQKYDLYIKQAQKYGQAVKELNKEIAKDPNNLTLIEQRNTWLKAQQEAIANAHSEKEAIADLVEKGIKKQIEAMEELIDKYEDALDAEKDQQKYADSIAEKQKKINSLQKQLNSMEGDDSEEGASRRQKLRNELKEAQKDLQETQEDQRLSEIKDALSDMQEKYEEVLNARLDNIDALLEEVVRGVNQSGADICGTIKSVASSVNYSITDVLNKIYSGVQNLSAGNADKNGQSGALVSGTSTTSGGLNNTSATTLSKSTNPVVPTTPSTPASSSSKTTSSSSTSGSSSGTKTSSSSSKNGLIKENGQTYYYKNDKKQTGWQTISGKKYYFDPKTGAMVTGVRKIGNDWYVFNKSTGVLASNYTGLYAQNGNHYYFKDGKIQTGWKSMKEGKRYFSVDAKSYGIMLTGVRKIGNGSYYFNSNGILQTGKFTVGDYLYETDKDGKIKKKTLRTGGTTAIKGSVPKATGSTGKKITGGGIKGYASGTKKVPKSDLYQVDEEGNEVFINKQGKIYTRLEKGTTVLPHNAAINLLKGMSNPAEFIANHMDMRPNKNITNTNNTTGDTVNYITFKMDGVTNYTEFMREAQRDPNFTKYIQEISIGKLNGNNSLRGNSIRFR